MTRPNLRHAILAAALICLAPATAQAQQIAQAKPSADQELQAEMLFWDSIKNSTDGGDYRAYLDTYPKGRFAPLARSRAKKYAGAAAPVTPAATTQKPTYQPKSQRTGTAATAAKPAYVPKDKRAGASSGASQQRPVTYVARMRTHVYKGPSTRTPRTGEFFVESESFKVTEVVGGGKWLKAITRSGKTGYIFAGQARRSGSTKRLSNFTNPDEQTPNDREGQR